jgi:hypothetical protein
MTYRGISRLTISPPGEPPSINLCLRSLSRARLENHVSPGIHACLVKSHAPTPVHVPLTRLPDSPYCTSFH